MDVVTTSSPTTKGKSKGSNRTMPEPASDNDNTNILKYAAFKLEEALTKEQSQFMYYNYTTADRNPWEVTMEARDGAVGVLRFLSKWFDMPSRVFFSAVSYLDQFLARMKVQAKFLSCVSVSCFKVAVELQGYKINASQLVMVSQSRCSVQDMDRMSAIIKQKLNLGKSEQHHNVLELLEIYLELLRCFGVQFKTQVLLNRMLQWKKLSTRLEVVIADSGCVPYKPSVIALAFIQYEMERFLSREIPNKSHYYSMEMFYILAVMIELQHLCKMKAGDYASCFENVTKVLKEYQSGHKAKHCQKLSWRFSQSTHSVSKLLRNYYSPLNLLQEREEDNMELGEGYGL